jgi:hypothetical protein
VLRQLREREGEREDGGEGVGGRGEEGGGGGRVWEVADGCLSEVLESRHLPRPLGFLLLGHTISPQARQTSPLRARYRAPPTHL